MVYLGRIAVTVDGRSAEAAGPAVPPVPVDDHYKWVALTNTTAGVLLATIDASILIIAMPDIFRGIKLDPLVPGNSVKDLFSSKAKS